MNWINILLYVVGGTGGLLLGLVLSDTLGPLWAVVAIFLMYMAQDAYTSLRVENELRAKNGKPPLFK